MKARNLITVFLAAALVSCDKPNPTNEPIIPETYTIQINTVSEDALNLPLPDRTDVYIYPSKTEIHFDTIDFFDPVIPTRIPYTLQHQATPPDTVRVSQNLKEHNIVLQEGEYKAVIRYRALFWYGDTIGYRYKVRNLNASSDTIINDTLYHKDFEEYKQLTNQYHGL